MANTTETVVVLQEETGFEGTIVLGVFTTEEKAEAFFQTRREAGRTTRACDYALMRAPLDPESQTDWDLIKYIF